MSHGRDGSQTTEAPEAGASWSAQGQGWSPLQGQASPNLSDVPPCGFARPHTAPLRTPSSPSTWGPSLQSCQHWPCTGQPRHPQGPRSRLTAGCSQHLLAVLPGRALPGRPQQAGRQMDTDGDGQAAGSTAPQVQERTRHGHPYTTAVHSPERCPRPTLVSTLESSGCL